MNNADQKIRAAEQIGKIGQDLTGPVRMCVICRNKFFKTDLTRHVRTEDGLEPDPRQIRPGRGYYLCTADSCA